MDDIKTRHFSNPRMRTMLDIEAVVEWIEAQNRPFTTSEAFNGARCGSHCTAYRTIRDLEYYGLIRRTNGSKANPPRWLAVGKQEALDG